MQLLWFEKILIQSFFVQEWRSGSPAWRQNLRETRTVAPQQHNLIQQQITTTTTTVVVVNKRTRQALTEAQSRAQRQTEKLFKQTWERVISLYAKPTFIHSAVVQTQHCLYSYVCTFICAFSDKKKVEYDDYNYKKNLHGT